MQLLLEAAFLEAPKALRSWQAYLGENDLQAADAAAVSLFPFIYANLKEKSHPLCKSVYRHTWVANQTLWSKTLPILNRLLDAGIEKIALLKGMALILHHYRNFGLRVIGDIDILIDRANVPLAHSLLTAAGWHCELRRLNPRNPEQLFRWHSANFTHPEGLNLDLHWSFLLESNPTVDQQILKDVPHGIQPLSPTNLLFQTCIHGNKKSPAPLIRWIPDALTLLKSPVDFQSLFDMARATQLSLPLSSAFAYLSSRFNVSIPPFKAQPNFFEIREFHANLKGQTYLAGYYRARINNCSLFHYLQHTANLPSPWLIPFYAAWWLFKRLYRFLKSFAIDSKNRRSDLRILRKR